MRKAELIDILAGSYLIGLIVVLLGGLFAEDKLLYHSGLVSLVLMANGLAVLFGLAVAAVSLAIAWPTKAGKGVSTIAGVVSLALIGAGFCLSLYEDRAGSIDAPWTFLLVLLGLTAAFAVGIWFIPDRSAILKRAAVFSRAVAATGLVLLCGGLVYTHLLQSYGPTPAGKDKHIVMVVIDGFPPRLLHTYEPGVKAGPMDRLAERATVFMRAHTNKSYTNGFFGVLYTGRLDHIAGLPSSAPKSLFGVLHSIGVRTRLISFHSNGFPQTILNAGYRGFRSSLLTENYTWIPELLGLDYDVLLAWPLSRRTLPKRLRFLYHALNKSHDEKRFWNDLVPRQITSLESRGGSSLLLIHVAHNPHIVQQMREYKKEGPAVQAFYNRAIDNKYFLSPKDAPMLKKVRAGYLHRAWVWGRRMQKLYALLKTNGWSKDTLFIVTADHGTLLERNKIWYGYHYDEEATRVPMLMLGAGLRAEKRRELVDSRDLAATLAGYFGGTFAKPDGRSLVAGALAERVVPVETIPNPLRKERFIVLYKGDRKFVFDIHPDGKGETRTRTVRRFDLAGLEAHPIPLDDPIWRDFAAAIRKYGIAPKDVHASMRAHMTAIAAKPRSPSSR